MRLGTEHLIPLADVVAVAKQPSEVPTTGAAGFPILLALSEDDGQEMHGVAHALKQDRVRDGRDLGLSNEIAPDPRFSDAGNAESAHMASIAHQEASHAL